MGRFWTTAMACAALWISGACAEASPLGRDVHDCSAGDAVACGQVEHQLDVLFAGGADAGDRAIARQLASAAVRVLRREPTAAYAGSTMPEQPVVAESLRTCAGGDRRECNRVARVLSGLFTGADAQLDASPERRLAHALADQMLSVAMSAGPRAMVSQSNASRR